uniref:ACB domain-containing protein n=1 Tax=Chromera velia CCMP2878 TaxID=1169474 RepID=A0A0G4F9D0_9ALVE|eukprot:Cvel_2997.t1-p1 / transcript=Cvel_2997.t1 / gene=Cvel_2997 / organism=Chromera_velia_CCMP2878 / gene_product=Acyl-CoA-binding protein homolog 3, putative / transcript_product=Acyl-CoA-binding protein homolog 3, putative / location=Cvel_scaffold119:86586-86879(+) / protein_length=98 / sequence_SO=supercontig / SO=protein_coding / is_pseudo=false
MSADDFELAAKFVQNLPKDGPVQPTSEQKLNFYKYFKQAKDGDVQGSQPWAVQMEARAKWDAWNSVKGMSTEDAKKSYVEGLNGMFPEWKAKAAEMGL